MLGIVAIMLIQILPVLPGLNMDLSTLGTIVSIIYLLGIFVLQWVTDWYFNATKSPILDHLHLCYYYWTDKFQKEQDNA